MLKWITHKPIWYAYCASRKESSRSQADSFHTSSICMFIPAVHFGQMKCSILMMGRSLISGSSRRNWSIKNVPFAASWVQLYRVQGQKDAINTFIFHVHIEVGKSSSRRWKMSIAKLATRQGKWVQECLVDMGRAVITIIKQEETDLRIWTRKYSQRTTWRKRDCISFATWKR